MKLAYFLLFSLCTLALPAQEYLGKDLPFFQKKARLYQRWLDQHQIGHLLSVDSVRLEKNGYELELFLHLKAKNEDEAVSLYGALQKNYVASPGNNQLEDELFNTFVRFMEVPAGQTNLQIYLRTPSKASYNTCFYVWIWQENEQIHHKAQINNCRSKIVEIEIPLPPVNLSNGKADQEVKASMSPKDIFSEIQAFARKKYEVNKPGCEDRQAQVLPPEKQSDYYLEFYVNDLCQEVLTEERKSLWCDFVESWWGACNDMRRERLEFRINLNRGEEAYFLSIKITGKFGSGLYRPRESSWMDMEPDFEDDFLKPYAKKFQAELAAYLLEKRP